MNTMEKREIKTPSLEERIKDGRISFEEAKREQERNYGEVIRHVDVPGNPKEEEWVVKINGKTRSFKGADDMEEMRRWAKENDGVIVDIEKRTGKTKVVAGELVDDIFLKKAAEDEARVEGSCFGD